MSDRSKVISFFGITNIINCKKRLIFIQVKGSVIYCCNREILN